MEPKQYFICYTISLKKVLIHCMQKNLLILSWYLIISLTHYMPLVSSHIPWKYQKTKCFLMFSGGIESAQWNGKFFWSGALVWRQNHSVTRRNHSQMIGVLKNFAIFIGKHLLWSLIFKKFIKKRLQSPCSDTAAFLRILGNFKKQIFIELLRWWWLCFWVMIKIVFFLWKFARRESRFELGLEDLDFGTPFFTEHLL